MRARKSFNRIGILLWREIHYTMVDSFFRFGSKGSSVHGLFRQKERNKSPQQRRKRNKCPYLRCNQSDFTIFAAISFVA